MADLQAVLKSPGFATLPDAAKRALLKEQFGVADDHMDKILSLTPKPPTPTLPWIGGGGLAGQQLGEQAGVALDTLGSDLNPMSALRALVGLASDPSKIPGLPFDLVKGLVQFPGQRIEEIQQGRSGEAVGHTLALGASALLPEVIPPALRKIGPPVVRLAKEAGPSIAVEALTHAVTPPGTGAVIGGILRRPIRKFFRETIDNFKKTPEASVETPVPPPVAPIEEAVTSELGIPAQSIQDLVEQAVPKSVVPKVKFTPEALDDIAKEAFLSEIPKKDAAAMIQSRLEGAHPEAIKKVISEVYARETARELGRPLPGEKSTKPAPKAAETKVETPAETPVERKIAPIPDKPPAIKALEDYPANQRPHIQAYYDKKEITDAANIAREKNLKVDLTQTVQLMKQFPKNPGESSSQWLQRVMAELAKK